jgi:hypothetical protein
MPRKPQFNFMSGDGERTIRVLTGCNLGFDSRGHKILAMWFPMSNTIKIDKDTPRHRYPRILNHEVTHVETPLDEETVEQLERGQANAQKALAEFLDANP